MKKHESGRSMVEMLGVLAIIGVLSVGGIAGYSLSMRRHRANGVVDIASKYALIGYNICQQKILNGDYKDISGCASMEVWFGSAGIGSTPAGLSSAMTFGGVTTNTTTGVDTVKIHVPFSDEKLCQAVASITGTGWGSADCNFLEIKFKQN